MKFTMTIDSGNVDTTQPTIEMALARYLRETANKIENYTISGSVLDDNGQPIGNFHLEAE